MSLPELRRTIEFRAAKGETITLGGLRRFLAELEQAGAIGTTEIRADVSLSGRRFTRIWATPETAPWTVPEPRAMTADQARDLEDRPPA